MSTQVKLIGLLLIIILSFGAGVTVTNWHQNSVELAAQKAAQKVADKFQSDQQGIAQGVVTSLDNWKKNNVNVQERIIREKLQPIFAVECVTPNYVSVFNDTTRKGATGASQPAPKTGN